MRRRQDQEQLPIRIKAHDKGATIYADKQWIAASPLSEFSLQTEQSEWAKAKFKVHFVYKSKLD